MVTFTAALTALERKCLGILNGLLCAFSMLLHHVPSGHIPHVQGLSHHLDSTLVQTLHRGWPCWLSCRSLGYSRLLNPLLSCLSKARDLSWDPLFPAL